MCLAVWPGTPIGFNPNAITPAGELGDAIGNHAAEPRPACFVPLLSPAWPVCASQPFTPMPSKILIAFFKTISDNISIDRHKNQPKYS
jgi:hypothetical protein